VTAGLVEAIVLGTAQDAGIPQIGCRCSTCEEARHDPSRRRLAACLAVVDHRQDKAWIVDAGPDLREQWGLLDAHLPGFRLAGILLTHAHIGHYLGLAFLGRESWAADRIELLVSPSMHRFLTANAPWSDLLLAQYSVAREVSRDEPVRLSEGLTATPIPVPHRDEHSDTLAWSFCGPTSSLFYCPDVDRWDDWPGAEARDVIASHDVALLDGTFFAGGEVARADASCIRHPPMRDAIKRFAGIETTIRFLHVNHTHPLLRCGASMGDGGVDAPLATRGDRWRL
jgi:pyrroloquinoline quinone biosynthesis protein B